MLLLFSRFDGLVNDNVGPSGNTQKCNWRDFLWRKGDGSLANFSRFSALDSWDWDSIYDNQRRRSTTQACTIRRRSCCCSSKVVTQFSRWTGWPRAPQICGWRLRHDDVDHPLWHTFHDSSKKLRWDFPAVSSPCVLCAILAIFHIGVGSFVWDWTPSEQLN